jgi:hypothetical protein
MKKEHRVCKSASHSKQSCRNSNFQRPPLPLKLCAFVRVSDAEDRAWGGDDAGDQGWGGVRGLQVNPLLRFDFHWNFLTQ